MTQPLASIILAQRKELPQSSRRPIIITSGVRETTRVASRHMSSLWYVAECWRNVRTGYKGHRVHVQLQKTKNIHATWFQCVCESSGFIWLNSIKVQRFHQHNDEGIHGNLGGIFWWYTTFNFLFSFQSHRFDFSRLPRNNGCVSVCMLKTLSQPQSGRKSIFTKRRFSQYKFRMINETRVRWDLCKNK